MWHGTPVNQNIISRRDNIIGIKTVKLLIKQTYTITQGAAKQDYMGLSLKNTETWPKQPDKDFNQRPENLKDLKY